MPQSQRHQFTHLRSLIKPSINSPSFRTYNLSLLLRASSICGSTSAGLPSTIPDASSFGVSASAELGERDRDQSAGGRVETDEGTVRPPLALDCGAVFVVAAAAIKMAPKEGEGEGMGDMEAEEGFVDGRNDGGSANKDTRIGEFEYAILNSSMIQGEDVARYGRRLSRAPEWTYLET